MVMGPRHEVPPLTEKLFTIDSCWEIEIRFILRRDAGYINHTRYKLYAQEHLDNTKLTPQLYFFKFI